MTDQAGAAERREGEEIVARARLWIGTPYVHQASMRGSGADCLGLIRGLWRERSGEEPEAVPAYTPDWSETDRVERLLEAARRHLLEIAPSEAVAGDVLAFRMSAGAVAKHLGLVARIDGRTPTIIHAYSGYGVVESPLTPAWRRRVAAAFRFPNRRI